MPRRYVNYPERQLVEVKEALQREYTKEVHRKVVKRLNELADGAQPESENVGICHDIDVKVFEARPRFRVSGYLYLLRVFMLMGLSEGYPLGNYGPTTPWEGEEGEERRALAADTAKFIESEFLTEGKEAK